MLSSVSLQRAHLSGMIDSGLRTSTTLSNVENSASVGIQYQFFLSSAKTALMACCCSTIHATISKVEPQRVATSPIILCWGNPSSSCFCLRSQVVFQLRWNSSTSEWHLPMAFLTLSLSKPFLIAKSRLWPKELIQTAWRIQKAMTMLDQLDATKFFCWDPNFQV